MLSKSGCPLEWPQHQECGFEALPLVVADPEQAGHDKEQDQDRNAVERDDARAALSEIKKEVGIPPRDLAHKQGVEQPRYRPNQA
jgi:hypothetical protein